MDCQSLIRTIRTVAGRLAAAKSGDAALRAALVLGMLLGIAAPLTQVAPAAAASTTSATFSGGTVAANGVLNVKPGAALTLTVKSSGDTKCIVVSGDHTGSQTSGTPQQQWTFSFTAPSGSGLKSVTATAYGNPGCNQGSSGNPATGSYTLDSTGPTVTGALSPAPNGAGWNNGNVTITWSAQDPAGIGGGPAPATESVTGETSGETRTAAATDALGNTGSGTATVKIDRTPPTIGASVSGTLGSNGWYRGSASVAFTCADGGSVKAGIKDCPAGVVVSNDGQGQVVSGTAVDNADNSATTSVSLSVDKTAPGLSGAATTAPNGAGWYKGDVAVAWTCADALSGIDGACPANSTVTGEGSGLTATQSVKDRAGNQTTATSAAVKIDRTAPHTAATAPAAWNNTDVTVGLSAADSLSGVRATAYKLNGGAAQSGTQITISSEGVHTLEFWSEDSAGNVEGAKSVQVKIDRTPPSITHTQAPAANDLGWNNGDVTVTFVCGDALSLLKSCTAPQVVTAEGTSVPVTGTAVDNAGNSATDPAAVSIDKTKPTIAAQADRTPDKNGWYSADVTVGFQCGDALSGVRTCTAPHKVGEGANQTASGTATDAAGNTAGTSLSGLSVDKTAPSLGGGATTAPNGSGWYKGDVAVAWTCSDALSGIDGACPANSTVTGEGSGLSAGAAVADKAGNSASATVAGVKIDRTAPSTTAAVPAPLASGWYGGAVQVTLHAVDSLSTVDKTYYSVDGGPTREYTGAFSHSAPGSSAITFWSTDKAGNVEDRDVPGHTLTLKIDNVRPAIAGTATTVAEDGATAPYTPGTWINQDVAVTFNCKDDESGVKSCEGSTVLSADGANHAVTGTATDVAGNSQSVKVENVKIDKSRPVLTVAANTADGKEYVAGTWTNQDVTVRFTCAEDPTGSGLAGPCPSDAVFAQTGEGLAVAPATVADRAGNVSRPAGFSGINIDKARPTIAAAAATDVGAYSAGTWTNRDVTVGFTCDDTGGSGVANCAAPKTVATEGAGQGASGTAADHAGNSSDEAGFSGINIDKTPPTLSGKATTDANAAGWYRGDVTVRWTAKDDRAGVDEATLPQDSVVEGEGDDLAAQAAVQDQAGNSGHGRVAGIKIDRTAPSIGGAATAEPNGDGWYNGPVTVRFTCADALAGIATCASDAVLNASGAGLSVAGDATDKAGNGSTATVSGINIDTAPPATTATINCTKPFGWCIGASATVVLTAADQPGLSGVKEIRYSVNGGGWQTASGAGASIVVALSGSGADKVDFYAVDRAGNAEPASGASLQSDTIAPAVKATVSPAANAAGWNKEDVTVSFDASDNAGGSGINTESVTASKRIAVETSGQGVEGEAYDNAGNRGTAAVTVKLDKAAPTIAGATTSSPNAGGWHNGPVTVRFTCADALAGIATCPADVTLTGNGAGQSVSGTAADKAGNEAGFTVAGINIDTVKPVVTLDAKPAYTVGAVAPTCQATDGDGSGLGEPCKVVAVKGTPGAAGPVTFKAVATDRAGNSGESAEVTVQVVYAFDGFLQPVVATAHQNGAVSTFKAGSTVPLKFQLKNAAGAVVQAGAAPELVHPSIAGATFRWDSAGQQYISTLHLPKSAAVYTVGVKLDDGQTYLVTINGR